MHKKLKRFLLRYDPPGLGIEIQTGGDDNGHLEIVHKDLPPASRMSSQEDILLEVDRLIAEDDLLTRKRHRPALIQLLGRLYQIDVDAVHNDEEADSPHQSKNKHSPKGIDGDVVLQEGAAVVLLGLKDDLAVHNGELGVLVKCRLDKHKFEVRLSNSGEEVKVKGEEHLVIVAPKGTNLTVGCAVVIRGLRNHTELNGCLGRVVECHEEAHRYEVRATESGQLFRVKQENLVPIDGSSLPAAAPKGGADTNTTPRGAGKKEAAQGGFPPSVLPQESAASLAAGADGDDAYEVGSIVELQGLKTAMAYNGQTAEVLSVDRSRARYEIRLTDGSVKTIRADNVRLISRPQKTSPRTRRKDGAPKGADRK